METASPVLLDTTTPGLANAPIPSYQIRAGVVLSRPPQITRDLDSFEKAFFFYQRRLNERLVIPFSRYLYHKKDTPADADWKRKYKERQAVAKDLGPYNPYSKTGWNDELLVGAKESEPEYQIQALLKDSIPSKVEGPDHVNVQQSEEEFEAPMPRVTEADKSGDQRSLNRLLQKTLYLLVRGKEGRWNFPHDALVGNENLHDAAERILVQTGGLNMNTWVIGRVPIGSYNFKFPNPRLIGEKKLEELGEKTFFIKARIMAGQADLAENALGLQEFKWLSKEEIEQVVTPRYFKAVRSMLADR
ncbi:MAG: 54S ribosomal protein L17 mitochondrial [Trizodia sp. TS-e1964]|nr:MAG: 54S ribosomal protein L17 mitochondrial [Trizodia sp. TS-e1964]